MAEQTEQARTVARDKEAEQKNLANALKAPEEGGANLGIEAGTDINTLPEETKKQITEEVNRRTYGISNPQFRDNVADMIDDGTEGAAGGQAVTDSTPARTEMEDLSTELEELEATQEQEAAKDQEVVGLTDEQRALFQAQEDLSTDTFKAAKESIESSTEAALQEAELSQAKQRGASRVQLARMGALGVSSAATQYLGDLENSFRKELAGIRERGQQLMQEASLAKRQGDLQLMRDRMDAIRLNREDAIQERQAYLKEVETMQRITQFNRESASATFDAMVAGGVTEEEMPEGYFDNMDRQQDYDSGVSRIMFSAKRQAFEKQEVIYDLEFQQSINTVLDGTPIGESIKVGEATYFGRSTDAVEVGADGFARRFVTMPDGSIEVQNLGQILPDEVGSEYGSLLGDSGYIWDQIMPEGSYFGGSDFIDPNTGQPFAKDKQGQCGAFVRWFTDGSFRVGNSYEEKVAAVNANGDITDSGDYRPGDVFIQKAGVWTGHIGIINRVKQLDDGDVLLTFTEANRNGDGKITHTKSMRLSELKNDGGFITRPAGIKTGLSLGADSGIGVDYNQMKYNVPIRDLNGLSYTDIAAQINDGITKMTDFPQEHRGMIGAALSATKSQEIINNGESDEFIAKLRESSGGKGTDATFRTQVSNAMTVVDQLGYLDDLFADDKALRRWSKENGGEKVDLSPITGIFRSQNPFDQKAREIESQLKAIVPKLARGIYGEVGVLTDADIKNYAQTIPNLKDTEAVRKALLSATVKLVGDSVKNSLEAQAAGGVDVSGYEDIYIEMVESADRLLDEAVSIGAEFKQTAVATIEESDPRYKELLNSEEYALERLPNGLINVYQF